MTWSSSPLTGSPRSVFQQLLVLLGLQPRLEQQVLHVDPVGRELEHVQNFFHGFVGAPAAEQGVRQQDSRVDRAVRILDRLAEGPDCEVRLSHCQQRGTVEMVELRVVGAGVEQLPQGRDGGRVIACLLLAADLRQASLWTRSACQDEHGGAEGEPPGGKSLHHARGPPRPGPPGEGRRRLLETP